MNRDKKIIILSHCILNQNSVVLPLARAKGAYNEIIKPILDLNIGVLQLPCPELIHLGLDRQPMTQEEYDTDNYNELCSNLLKPVIKQLLYYKNSGYKIIGLVGIDESPTCSFNNNGILIKKFIDLLNENHIEVNRIAIPTTYQENTDTSFSDEFKKWLLKILND